MNKDKPKYFSLTGEDSHKVTIPLGQGSFSIGTKGRSEGKYDAWVEKDTVINWNVFNDCFTGYGEQNKQHYPCGNWPRFFYYSGNDIGFAYWSKNRKIEDFHWFPQGDISVDFTDANINRFMIHSVQHQVEISIGDKQTFLSLSGNLENIKVKKCTTIPSLHFSPKYTHDNDRILKLPLFNELEKAKSIDIDVSPMGKAFNCRSLLQFTDLVSLNLKGNMTNLEALVELPNLERIGLRFVPNLIGMPDLKSFKNLSSFIGYNIEEKVGKDLRTQLKKLSNEKELNYSSITQLRKTIWFTTEYGIPFAEWESKIQKVANKAYKTCLKQMNKAKTMEEAHDLIVVFIKVFNQLENIETTEREDVGRAVYQLTESSNLGIKLEMIDKWFDDTRYF